MVCKRGTGYIIATDISLSVKTCYRRADLSELKFKSKSR